MDEVIEIIEPAVGIIDRPLVQVGLHSSYPSLSLIWDWPRLTSIHQRLRPLQFLHYLNPLDPFAMYAAFLRSDYYGSSAQPRAVGGRRTYPTPRAW